ncbi:MAG TPA: FHA domain-containing protein [Candidatus Thermoplasmatota archaeon]|nr:FHA domain-containing protein [Candidatus Thermoplasmatota archaeon]
MAHEGAIPYEQLARHLRVLGAPGRLELLRRLHVPRALGEIELAATRASRDRTPGRQLTRATIAAHLRTLEEVGLVQARASTRDGQPVVEYALQQARLFVVLDELRRVGLLRPRETGDTVVEDVPDVTPPEMPGGATFLLVNGPHEARAFPLDGPGPWVIGRDPRAHVPLPYDPFVSRENTRIAKARGGRFVLASLPDAPNGTLLNWRPLAGEATLVGGDVVSVGRTLLVFREGDR